MPFKLKLVPCASDTTRASYQTYTDGHVLYREKSVIRCRQITNWIWKANSGLAATIQTFIAQVLVLGTNLATGMITARFLGAEGRGEQAALILWPQFLGFMFAMGLGPALLYHLKKTPEEESKLFSAAMIMGCGLSIVATAIGIIFMPRWLAQYPPRTIGIAQLFMLTTPLSLLSLIVLAAYRAQGKFSVVNKTEYLYPTTTLVSLASLSATNLITPFAAALSYKIPYTAITCWKITDLWKHYRPKFRGLGSSYRRLLSYSTRSAGVNIVSQVAQRIDQAMVIGLLSPMAMGIYVVALNLTRLLGPLNKSILSVLLPKTAAKPAHEVVKITGRAARVSLFISTVEVIVIMAVAPYILITLYGQEFSDAVNIFRILLVRKVVEGTALILSQAFMALGHPGIMTALQLTGLALTIPLLIILIPKWGLVGVGVALLISAILRLVFAIICYPIFVKVSPPSLLLKKSDIAYFIDSFSRKKKTRRDQIAHES